MRRAAKTKLRCYLKNHFFLLLQLPWTTDFNKDSPLEDKNKDND